MIGRHESGINVVEMRALRRWCKFKDNLSVNEVVVTKIKKGLRWFEPVERTKRD